MGRAETGIITHGMVVTFAPNQLTTEVYHESLPEATPGDCLIQYEERVCEGYQERICCIGLQNKPATGVSDFTAQVIVLNHPGQVSNEYSPVLDCHTAHITCKVKYSLYAGFNLTVYVLVY